MNVSDRFLGSYIVFLMVMTHLLDAIVHSILAEVSNFLLWVGTTPIGAITTTTLFLLYRYIKTRKEVQKDFERENFLD